MGAGYHGGFGATRGSAYKILKSTDSIPTIKISTRKQDIVDALMGVTEMSTLIAENINHKKIGLNILGDKLFDSMLDRNRVRDPNTVNGFQDGNQIYIRRSGIKGYSVFVHEGSHAYDFIHDIPQFDISSHKGEYKAYLHEHEYQKKKGEHLDFKNHDEILVHIKINYKY